MTLYFYGYVPGDICWLDKVSWVPAPEKMEITFDTGDGPAVTTCRVTPGTRYVDLPTPDDWGMHDFCGWYLDPAFTEKVNGDDLVQFRDQLSPWGFCPFSIFKHLSLDLGLISTL